MILNGYAILLLLMDAIRLPLALIVVTKGFSAVLTDPRAIDSERRKSLEDQSYLLMVLVIWLVSLNVLSWPLLYWLLQSYVPEWPDVMCIYGVTKIGTGSLGTSRHLPGVIGAVQLLKPLVMFLCGSWFVTHWLNRKTANGVLLRQVLACSLFVGLASIADSSLEASYVLIPKRVDLPSVGCCTMLGRAQGSEVFGSTWREENGHAWLSHAYYAVNVLMIAALTRHLSQVRTQATILSLGSLMIGGIVAAAVSFLFLHEIAAPQILHLPDHHCAYDLISRAPESVVGIALFLFGSLAVGWAGVTFWLGQHPATSICAHVMLDRVLFLALFGYLSSLILISIELGVSA